MKTYYKINEISKLYGIGLDSLRYYEEIGILHPTRDKNNYRQYTTKDICRLNVIRDLRSLGFSMASIQEYLNNQSVAQSLALMEQEECLIHQKICELEQLKVDIQRRKLSLKAAKELPFLRMDVQELPKRKCVSLKTDVVHDDTEYQLMILSKEFEKNIYSIANFNTGFMLDITDLDHIYPTSVFISGDSLETYEFDLPSGTYLTMYYAGKRDKHYQYIKDMLAYSKTQNWSIESPVLEFSIIDVHETKNPDEFITQLQIKIHKES